MKQKKKQSEKKLIIFVGVNGDRGTIADDIRRTLMWYVIGN